MKNRITLGDLKPFISDDIPVLLIYYDESWDNGIYEIEYDSIEDGFPLSKLDGWDDVYITELSSREDYLIITAITN